MDIQFGMSIIMILYLGAIMAIAGLGIYTLTGDATFILSKM